MCPDLSTPAGGMSAMPHDEFLKSAVNSKHFALAADLEKKWLVLLTCVLDEDAGIASCECKQKKKSETHLSKYYEYTQLFKSIVNSQQCCQRFFKSIVNSQHS
jgi:hypothetical protein